MEQPFWHCVARGVRRCTLFVDDADRATYLEMLRFYLRRVPAAVLVYALMGNHFHLLLRGERKEIGHLFQMVHTRYAVYFNRRHEFRGHAFESGIRVAPVRSPLHLLHAAMYILLNPLKDFGMPPERYAFTSYASLFSQGGSDWLDPGPVLSLFGADREKARQLFLETLAHKARSLGEWRARRNLGERQARLPAMPSSSPYTEEEVRMVLETLLDPSVGHRASLRYGLPREALVLYTAWALGLAGVRKLAAFLSLPHKRALRYLKRIRNIETLSQLLASPACLTKGTKVSDTFVPYRVDSSSNSQLGA